jgi:hypothetical protein
MINKDLFALGRLLRRVQVDDKIPCQLKVEFVLDGERLSAARTILGCLLIGMPSGRCRWFHIPAL